MGKTTAIAYCDSTCNPLIGCDGCELWRPGEQSHCYAQQLVTRFAGRPWWPTRFDRPIVRFERIVNALAWPDLTGLARPDKPWLNAMPRVVFLCDLGDPFTESAPHDWLAAFLQPIAESRHIWLLLTKRPRRLRDFAMRHPLPPNLWAGTTVTAQDTLWRAEELCEIAGRHGQPLIRWLSLEPLLGPVDLSAMITRVQWVVAGGESGLNARPAHPDWFRAIRARCVEAGVAFFFKQWGEWCPCDHFPNIQKPGEVRSLCGQHRGMVCRAGVKAAGRNLDGREWGGMPVVTRILS